MRNDHGVKASISLLGYAEGMAEDLEYQIKHLKKELAEAESKLVGARETMRTLREQLRMQASQEVIEECTSREVEILRRRGIIVSLGDTISPSIRAALREAAMS